MEPRRSAVGALRGAGGLTSRPRVREENCRPTASREVPPQGRHAHRQTPLRAEANDRERVDAAGHERLEAARGRSDDRAARLEDQVELSNRHGALGGNNRLTEIEPQWRGCPFVDDDRPRRMRRTKCRGDPTDVRLLQISPLRNLEGHRTQQNARDDDDDRSKSPSALRSDDGGRRDGQRNRRQDQVAIDEVVAAPVEEIVADEREQSGSTDRREPEPERD